MSEERETVPDVGVFNMQITTTQDEVHLKATFEPEIDGGSLDDLMRYPGFFIAGTSKSVAETMFDLEAIDQISMWDEVMNIVRKYQNLQDGAISAEEPSNE